MANFEFGPLNEKNPEKKISLNLIYLIIYFYLN